MSESAFIDNYLIYAINEPGRIEKVLSYYKAEKVEKFNGNYIKNFKIWGIAETLDNTTENDINYSLSEYRNQYFLKYKAEEEKKRLEQEKLEAEKKVKKEIKKLNLEIDKIIEDFKKKIADISEPIKFSEKKHSTLIKNLLNEVNKIKSLEVKYVEQNESAKRYITKDLYSNCLPGI